MLNENDVWLLVRAVRENGCGQTNVRVEPGEKAAAKRLVKRGLVVWTSAYTVCPTDAAVVVVKTFISIVDLVVDNDNGGRLTAEQFVEVWNKQRS